MKERQLTFTDLDENPLVVRLGQDRIRLSVCDSHPELAAGELRGFAAALFAAYLGPQAIRRIATARARLAEARDARGAGPAIEAAVRAIDDVIQVMTDAGAIEPAELARPANDGAAPRPAAPRSMPYPALKPGGKSRAEDGGRLWGWGWTVGGAAAR